MYFLSVSLGFACTFPTQLNSTLPTPTLHYDREEENTFPHSASMAIASRFQPHMSQKIVPELDLGFTRNQNNKVILWSGDLNPNIHIPRRLKEFRF